MPEPFLAFVPYLALVVRLWVGANMMIHGYSKLKPETGGRRDEENTRHPRWSYLYCNHIGILRWILPDNRPNCSDSWTVFCYFHDRKCDYEENKDECSVHCSGKASYEIDITYLILSIILIVLGAGALSIDSVIGLW